METRFWTSCLERRHALGCAVRVMHPCSWIGCPQNNPALAAIMMSVCAASCFCPPYFHGCTRTLNLNESTDADVRVGFWCGVWLEQERHMLEEKVKHLERQLHDDNK
eukprot:2423208-Rhodomonas_salina.1